MRRLGLIIAIAYPAGPQYRARTLGRGFDSMGDYDLNGYRPTDDEDFMNGKQKAYFRKKLEDWKNDILDGAKVTIGNLRAESSNHPDLVDRASAESDKALELRTRDRQRKLISKIDAAIRRIDEGTYGYCDDTGEPIGLRRLEARPTATLSLEAQERHERNERVVRDD
jgi:DnaK suppressor protein